MLKSMFKIKMLFAECNAGQHKAYTTLWSVDDVAFGNINGVVFFPLAMLFFRASFRFPN
jgi:hypothetical protein